LFFWLNIQGVVALKKTRISGISIEKTEHITVGQLDRTKKRGNNPRNWPNISPHFTSGNPTGLTRFNSSLGYHCGRFGRMKLIRAPLENELDGHHGHHGHPNWWTSNPGNPFL
jgi:hypothetical protein